MKLKTIYLFILFIVTLLIPPISYGSVKIVTWNILDFPGPDFEERIDDFRLILDEIDPDILVVQQMLSQEGVTKFKNKVLNYKLTKPYAKAPFFDGPDSDNAVFYKKEILHLISHQQIPTSFRDISEYYFRIKKGPGKKKSFKVFSVHFKAGKSTSDKKERERDAKVLRDYLNTLPRKSLFVVCGGFNIYGCDEKAFDILTRAQLNNNGRLIDPIRKIDNWHDKKKHAKIHTQSTRKTSFGGGASGGLDDRFDMHLISKGLAISHKLTYKPYSYKVFGNDGKRLNNAINFPENEAVSEKVADALHRASDHLPVIIELEPLHEDFPQCFPNLPNPNLVYTRSEDYVGSDGNDYTRYFIEVTNRHDFPDELFQVAPHLPPCGLNPRASRSWVHIYDNSNNRLYGFCGFVESENLGSLWFARPRGVAPPASVYIRIHDRECNIMYTSNLAPIIE